MWTLFAVALSFAAFWSVASRHFVVLRMAVFCGLVLLLLNLLGQPYDDDIINLEASMRHWRKPNIKLRSKTPTDIYRLMKFD